MKMTAKSGFKPTRAQKNAIEAHGGQITVSAAAGSGKTRVLVQRVIRLITQLQIPADRLLILTFTNTAAAEMRSRIARTIDDLIAGDPSNDFFRRQQLLLGSADICTIDSYCSKVVRENFFRLGISRDYRIGSDTELHEMRRRIMSDIIEAFYRESENDENKSKNGFSLLSMLLTDTKLDTDLENQLLCAYDKYSAHAFPEIWMENCISQYLPGSDINKSECAKYLMDRIYGYTGRLRKILDCAAGYIPYIEAEYHKSKKKSFGAVLDAYNSYEYFLSNLEDFFSEEEMDISAAADSLSDFQKVRIAIGSSKDEQLKAAASLLGRFASSMENELLEYTVFNEEMLQSGNESSLPVILALKAVLEEFDSRYFAAKTEKGILDFHDLERLMLRLLYEKDEESGKYNLSEFAKELSLQYDEIMIDEYQDTNDIQESIFKAVSRNETNLFVVGDVKQSIYRFRDAEPKIFKQRCERASLYNEDDPKFPALIILDKNFRSRQGIIDASNYVFGLLMSEKAGEIEYDETQRLTFGADYPEREKPEPDTEVHYLTYNKGQSTDEDDSSVDSDNKAEAVYCARMIKKMINEGFMVSEGKTMRAARYGDFCILLRAVRNKAHIYSEELENAGIPACTDTEYDLLEKYEIRAAVSYLRIMNNPLSDVDMAASLLCPAAGFTPDELAQLKDEKGRRYYKKLLRKSEDNDTLGKKCSDFLARLRYFRTLSVTMPCDSLIAEVFEKTGFICAVGAMKNSEQRVRNLRRFIRFAADYENSTGGGLTGFVRHIRYLEETGSGIKVNDTVPVNAVRIMTIHHSKGLEFPVCILAGTRTSKNNTSEKINFHPTLGIGMRAMDDNRFISFNTLQYTAIKAANIAEEKSEQMRVLYVAMTRAKEKLIILSTVSDSGKNEDDSQETCESFRKYLQSISEKCSLDESGRFDPLEVMFCRNYSDWITMCMLVGSRFDEIRSHAQTEIEMKMCDCPDIRYVYQELGETEADEAAQTEAALPDESVLEELESVYKEYKQEISTLVPSKVTASMLAHKGMAPEFVAASRPVFARKEKISPTERGTATHEFLQYADFENLYSLGAEEGLSQEKVRLVNSGIMTSEESELIIEDNIKGFVQTDLFRRMVSSSKLYREYRFTVNIPAELALANEPDIIQNSSGNSDGISSVMQGAIDCIFEESDGMVIVDYKTDRVKQPQELSERYSLQLKLYKAAAEKLFEKPVKQCYIYSLHCCEAVEV